MRLVAHQDLSDAKCWELLNSQHLGCVALSLAALPAIVPVSYAVDGGQSTISLHPLGVVPDTVLDGQVIAFHVAVCDPDSHDGWTVQIVGVARMTATQDAHGTAIRRVVELTPTIITGERLQDDFPQGATPTAT